MSIEEEKREPRTVSRRQFMVGTGVAVVGSALVGVAAPVPAKADGGGGGSISAPVAGAVDPAAVVSAPPVAGVGASVAYLVVDTLKCSGCVSCMLACSSAHEKKASLSASRIQITQTPLTAFPFDVDVHQCRQCVDPLCVEKCPTGACMIDAANGNIRMIDEAKCIGCQTCLSACPFVPHRVAWNAEASKAVKCDLCADAPYLGQQGGPNGKQACVMTCPMGAIAVVTEVPNQRDLLGYVVNLRKD